ncbi:unnamed protein product [Linum trigynum]|uniref:Reverse transcriptase Ty1/copia-type domain-containing protein n=1 Tax=Linum trigynum TaxID=586398 RepID=A0AAV2EEF6_9ROSI
MWKFKKLECKYLCLYPLLKLLLLPAHVEHDNDLQEQQMNGQAPPNIAIENEPNIDEPKEIALRRSTRNRRPAISDDNEFYLQKLESDLGLYHDPISFSQAMESEHSDKWLAVAKEEMKSMYKNEVWDLVDLPEGCKRVGNRWVLKTKHDSNGNIERHRARLVAKGFTQKSSVDYKETFSPVSKKDSLRIIMALVAHYNLELY